MTDPKPRLRDVEARAEAAIRAVLDLHPRGEFHASGGMVWFGRTEFPDQCTTCRDDWPCVTVRALSAHIDLDES